MSQVDTAAAVLHDCQCHLSGGLKPTAYGFYRGFIWHEWKSSFLDGLCLLPVEMPIEEAAERMGTQSTALHRLGNGEETACIWRVVDLTEAEALVDRFWENLKGSHEPTE